MKKSKKAQGRTGLSADILIIDDPVRQDQEDLKEWDTETLRRLMNGRGGDVVTFSYRVSEKGMFQNKETNYE